MYPIEQIVDDVIKNNAKTYEKAKYDPSYISALRNECVRLTNRQVTPLLFSSAIARRIEKDLEREEREQNGN